MNSLKSRIVLRVFMRTRCRRSGSLPEATSLSISGALLYFR
jgi:hypothetical protein